MTAALAQPPVAPTTSRGGRFDVAIIGGGAVGLATAMALATRHRGRVVVLETEDRLAAHQTGHNSGVIHSGLYYKPGSLKARLCTEGRELLYRFCQEQAIPYERCGKIVVATCESELPALAELQRRGAANGLGELAQLSIDQLREHEPHVTGVAGAYVSQTGIVDFPAVARAYAKVAQQHGGEVRTSSRVIGLRQMGGEIILETTRGEVRAGGLVNCAGLQCDRVARICGLRPEVRIIPFRGEYYKLRLGHERLVRNLIYPVPDARFPFLGVHFTRMIGGGVEAGPNAVLAMSRHGYAWRNVSLADTLATTCYPGFWRMARRHWKTGCGEIHRSLSRGAFLKALQRLLPELPGAALMPGGSGVRAQAVEPSGALVDDFRILESERMVHVLNAPSPAATASISIGRYIAALVAQRLSFPSRG